MPNGFNIGLDYNWLEINFIPNLNTWYEKLLAIFSNLHNKNFLSQNTLLKLKIFKILGWPKESIESSKQSQKHKIFKQKMKNLFITIYKKFKNVFEETKKYNAKLLYTLLEEIPKWFQQNMANYERNNRKIKG